MEITQSFLSPYFPVLDPRARVSTWVLGFAHHTPSLPYSAFYGAQPEEGAGQHMGILQLPHVFCNQKLSRFRQDKRKDWASLPFQLTSHCSGPKGSPVGIQSILALLPKSPRMSTDNYQSAHTRELTWPDSCSHIGNFAK